MIRKSPYDMLDAIERDHRHTMLLHRACDEHDPFLIFTLYGYPTTARLREDPRFAEIRERMGLPSPL